MCQFSGHHKPRSNQLPVQSEALLAGAIQLHQNNRLSEAEQVYRRILQIEPEHPEALHLLGVIAHQKNDHQKALQLISRAIGIEPQNPRFYNNLGLAFEALDQMPDAIQSYQQALQLDPKYAAACNNMGHALKNEGRFDAAIAYLHKAIQLAPQMPQAQFNLAKILAQNGNLARAHDHYQQAINLKPDYEKAYNNLGNVLVDQGQIDAAIQNFHKAIEIKPDYLGALNNLGNALRLQNRTDEAIEIFKQAIQQTPDSAESYCHLGNAFKDHGEFDTALRHYQQAIQITPNFAEAHFNRSIVLLLSGNFSEGWKEYEWRLQRNEWQTICSQRTGLPRWGGQSFVGKRLFVYDEQGFGDTLQFARYLPLVKDRGGTVIFETRRELTGLFKNFTGIDQVIERQSYDRPVVAADFYIPLLSLPGIFKTHLETIPNDIPYLFADPAKAAYWNRWPDASEFKVGIVWAGQPIHGEDRNRSCTLSQFEPLIEIPGVQLIGLQKGPAARQQFNQEEANIHFANLGEEFKDFSDTAGLIENLDLVISVDTAVAHLAGAMGKPVWVLLPFIPDWRWMIDRADSPWYPSMRLFRQKTKADWNSVFERIADELRTLVESHRNKNQLPLTPSAAESLFRQGNRFYDRNDVSKAISAYQKAIKIKDDFFEAYFNLGTIYQDQEDFEQAHAYYQTEEAISAYQHALELKPDFAQAYNNMGAALQKQGKLDRAIECFQKAIEIKPAYAPAYCNMAKAFHLQGKLAEAQEYYLIALQLKADYVEAYYGLGNIFLDQDNLAEMTRWYQKALAFTPQDADACNNLGKMYQDQKKMKAAENCFQEAIRIRPDFAEAHFNRGVTLLSAGNYVEGWAEYEWRFKMDRWKNIYPYQFEKPRWDGTCFAEKKIFVHCEQGLGDTIQFIRYLPMVKARGGKVIFETAKPFINMLHSFPGIDQLREISPHKKTTEDFDFFVPLLSLPGIFQTTLETIPQEVPYIFADPNKKWTWHKMVDKSSFKVGIVWAGGNLHKKDNNRSFSLIQFLPLSRIPGVRLYGLQKGPASQQVEEFSNQMRIKNYGEKFVDFTDTAALIDNLDLVISVDTAVAHLAGAMGKPVWVLLPFIPDWRWMLEREDIPWYPTMRLFRQQEHGNWDEVLQRVANELSQWVRQRTASQDWIEENCK
jgi:tetratricopeptide (TPR) repeat protein